jgi:hypothetical protein
MAIVAVLGFGIGVAWIIQIVIDLLSAFYGDRDQALRQRLSEVWDRLHEQSAAQVASASASTFLEHGLWLSPGAQARASRFVRWSTVQVAIAILLAMGVLLPIAGPRGLTDPSALRQLLYSAVAAWLLSLTTWYFTLWLLRACSGWRTAAAYTLFAAAALLWLYVAAVVSWAVPTFDTVAETADRSVRLLLVDVLVTDSLHITPVLDGLFTARHLTWYWFIATVPAQLLFAFCAFAVLLTWLPTRSTAAFRWLVFQWAAGNAGVLERSSKVVAGIAGALAAIAQWITTT